MKMYVIYVVVAMSMANYNCQTSTTTTTNTTTSTTPTTTTTTTTTTPAPPTTTTPTTTALTTTTLRPIEEETGFLLTIYSYYSDVRLRQFPFIPGYEDEITTVPSMTMDGSAFRSVDVDLRRRQAFFYDYFSNSLMVVYNYNSDYKTLDNMIFKTFHIGVSRADIQITIDYLTNTLYIADAIYRWIIAAPTSKAAIDLGLYKVIVDTHLEHPDGLAVDPVNKYLFWSDNGKQPKIERSNLFGGERHTLIKTGLHEPMSLDLDIPYKRIYWIDSYSETVMSADYTGSDRRIVKRVYGSWLFDTAIYKDVLAVTDTYNDKLYFFNKTSGDQLALPFEADDEIFYSVVTYNLDNQPLGPDNNPDPCAILNCSHLCINTASDGPQCHCADGYKLNTTTNACDEDPSGSLEVIVMASSTHVCFLDIRSLAYSGNYEPQCKYTVIQQNRSSTSTTPAPTAASSTTPAPNSTIPPPTAAPGQAIKMFDIDMANRILYYVSENNTIWKRLLDLPISNPAKEQVADANGQISGLLFDWIGSPTLYWCESDTNSIFAIQVANLAKRTVTTEATKPSALALLPHKGTQKLIYSSKTTDDSSSLMEIDLVGGTPNTLATDEDVDGHIMTLAVDQHKQIIYWIKDNDYVYKFEYDNTEREVMLQKYTVDDGIVDLIHYNNYLVWSYPSSDGSHSEIQALDLTKNLFREYGSIDESLLIVDMKILDINQQPPERTPCSDKNGGCDQICVMAHENGRPYKECLCALGYTVVKNQKCTTSLVAEDYIVVVDWTNDELLQISLEDESIHAVGVSEPGEIPYIVIYDQIKNRIMWTSLTEPFVTSYDMDTEAISKIHADGNYYLDELSLDESTGNMYVSDFYDSIILLLSPNGETKLLIQFDNWLDHPGGIALDPKNGYMYFALSSYFDYGYIARADMDGTNMVKLLEGNDDEDYYPGSLVMDYYRNHLYFEDSNPLIRRCTINSVNDTCDQMVIVYNGTKDALVIEALTIDSEYLYFTAYTSHFITRIRLTNYALTEQFAKNMNLGRLRSQTVYRPGKMISQPTNDICSARGGRGGCSSICIPSPTGYTCACEGEFEIQEDLKTCPGVFTCRDYVSQKSSVNPVQEVRIPIDSNCNGFVGDECTYRCPNGWKPANSSLTSLTCNPTGWGAKYIEWNETLQLCVEIQCPLLTHNTLEAGCSRRIGSHCNFNCRGGTTSKENMLACTEDGTWNKDVDKLCQAIMCDKTVKYGELDANCSPTPLATCNVTCMHGFDADTAQITCGASGKWNTDIDTVCKAVTCPTTWTDGKVKGCTRHRVGEQCQYDCNTGYEKAVGVDKITCLKDGTWYAHGKTPCKALCESDQFTCKSGECIPSAKFCDETNDCPDESDEINCKWKCQDTFINGTGNPKTECSLEVGSVCEAVCKTGYTNITNNVFCNKSKQWHPENICQVLTAIPTADAQTQSDTSTSESGYIAVVVILAVLVLIFVVVIVLLLRRRKSEGSYSASFSNGATGSHKNMAIQNPGYNNANIAVTNDKGDADYDNVDLNRSEPLRDVTSIDVNNDNTALTSGTWQKF